jgi:chromosome segregation ATPase
MELERKEAEDLKESIQRLETRITSLENRISALEGMKETLKTLENWLSAIDESIKKLENRIDNLESKQQIKPEEKVKQLEEALTPPKPPSEPIEELIKKRDALLEAIRPKPKFATVKEVIYALKKAREEAEKAKLRLEIAQLMERAIQEIKKAEENTQKYLKQAEETEARLAEVSN